MVSNIRKIVAYRTTLLLENEKQWLLLKFITNNHCFLEKEHFVLASLF